MKLPILATLAVVATAQCMQSELFEIGQSKTAVKLLKNDPNYINPSYNSCVEQMATAVVQGNKKKLKNVLEKNPNQSVNIRVTEEGQYPIHLAALQIRNGVEMIKILLDRNSDIDCLDNEGKTPLASAAAANNTKAIALLLKKGTRRSWDNDQENPYYNALCGGAIEAIKLLIASNIPVTKHEVDLAKVAIAYFANKPAKSYFIILYKNAQLAKELFKGEIKKQKNDKKKVQKNGYAKLDQKKLYFPWHRKVFKKP